MSEKPGWKVMSKTRVYENPWLALDHHDVIAPTGNAGIYGKVHFKNLAIGVLPIDGEGHTWLVGQHRFCFDAWSWELPEGGGARTGDPLDAARRELAEETGIKAKTFIPLLSNIHLSNSVTDEVAFAYIATDLSPCSDYAPDETELLEVRRVPLKTVFAMIDEGEITDMFTLAMLSRAYHLANTGRLPEAVASVIRSC